MRTQSQAVPAVIPDPEPSAEGQADQQDQEAYLTLLDLAHKKTGHIPEAVLSGHALAVSVGADWPVRRAALDALLRRVASMQKEKLRVVREPSRGRVLGVYRTERPRHLGGQRPYDTLLLSVDPPAGRCGCPDFAKSSLGLCKHLLALLNGLYPKRRRLAAARAEQPAYASDAGPARIGFDPIRPLLGPADWLMNLRWEPGHGGPDGLAARRARRWFVQGGPGQWPLQAGHQDDPKKRLALVRDLLAWLRETTAQYRDPAAVALLTAEEERLSRRLPDQALAAAPERALAGLKCPLYPYQIEGVAQFLRAGRLLLADDMGLGKTAQAIGACVALWHAGRVRRGLICVPASLKPQWLREWQHFTALPLTMVDGGPEQRAAQYRQTGEGLLLVNYEQVMRDLPQVQAFAPELVVLDEAQRIKNWATKTAACIKALDPAYRLVLTGTPMQNRLEELASVMEWVDPQAIEPKWRLAPWHTVQGGQEGPGGARNLDTLRQRLAPSMLRRVRQEVLQQLPPRMDTRVPVEMTPQQRVEHEELLPAIRRLVWIMKRRPLTPEEHLRLMQLLTTQRIICNGLAQLRFAEVWPPLREAAPDAGLLAGLFAPKLEALRELVRNVVVGQERKLVLFSQWRRMLTLAHWAMQDILGEAGLRAVFFTGAESAAKRTQNIVEFHDDPATRVMLLTDAGGVGLNLQRAASCCINLELPWNPAVLEQRIGRIYRLGQKLPIDVYNLVAEGGIESRIALLIGSKRALFAGLFDGTSNEVRYDQASSFLARVEQLLPPDEPGCGAPEEGEELDGALGTLGEREVDAVLSQADEAQDGVIPGEAVHTQAPELGGAGRGPAAAAAAQTEPAATAAAMAGEPGIEIEAASAAPAEPATEETALAPAEPATGEATVAPAEPTPSAAAGAAVSADAVRQLLGQVSLKRRPDGGMTIEAPPGAAQTLAALFGGMAQLLSQAGQS